MSRKVLVLALILAAGGVFLSAPSGASEIKPALTVSVSSANLTKGQRSTTATINAAGLRSCQISLSPQVAGFPRSVSPCDSAMEQSIVLPVNASLATRAWKLTISGISASAKRSPASIVQGITQAPEYRVAIFGDSISYQTGPQELGLLEKTKSVQVQVEAFPAEAICAVLGALYQSAVTFKPDAVVLEYIGSAYVPRTKTASYGDWTKGPAALKKWLNAQQRDLVKAITILKNHGVKKIYLDQGPVSVCPACNIFGEGTRNSYAQLRTDFPGLVSYVTPGTAVEGPGGTWAKNLPCLADEIAKNRCNAPSVGGVPYAQVRGPDGFHLCDTTIPNILNPPGCPHYSSGAFRYAASTASLIIQDWGLSPVPVFLPPA